MHHKPESPESIIHILRGLERKAKARDIRYVVVLCRRRKTDEKNEPGAVSQQSQMPPNEYDTLLDNKMNRLLKDNFFHYFDLKLTNSAFKVNDMVHQTQTSRNLSPGRIIRSFREQDS